MGNQVSSEPLSNDISTLFIMLYVASQQLYNHHLKECGALESMDLELIAAARQKTVDVMNQINPQTWSLQDPWPTMDALRYRYQIESANKTLVRMMLQQDVSALRETLQGLVISA